MINILNKSFFLVALAAICSIAVYAQPTVTLSTNSSNPTNDNPITVFVDFSEEVTGLELSDFSITNSSTALLSDSEISVFNTFGSSGSGNGEFNNAVYLAIGSEGRIYVSDRQNHRVQIFESNGDFISSFGSFGSENGEFHNTNGIAFDKNNNIYVADGNNHRIQIFNKDGDFIKSFTSGQKAPTNITVDNSLRIYITETFGHQVKIFDNNGNLTRKFGIEGDKEGEFSHPSGIALDQNNNIYVCDYRNKRVQVFNNNGNYLFNHPNPTNDYPQDIYIDSNDLIYVLYSNDYVEKYDKNRNRINFSYLSEQLSSNYGTAGITVDKQDNIHVTRKFEISSLNQNPKKKSFALTPQNDGNLSIHLPENSVQNGNGDSNLPSNTLNMEYDGTSPSVSLSSSHVGPTDQYPFVYDIVFSEPVIDFNENSISISSYSSLTLSGSGNTYQVEVWPFGNSRYSISILANQVTDLALNKNLASNEITIDFNTSIPNAILSTSENSPTNNSMLLIDVLFSELVVAPSINDFNVTNGTIDEILLNESDEVNSIQLKIVPTLNEGLVTIYLKNQSVHNTAFNFAPESNHIEIDYDDKQPIVSFESETLTNSDPIVVTARFNEEVTDFTIEDLLVEGAGLSNFNTLNGMTYQFDIQPTANGEIQISIQENVVLDNAGNGNIASNNYVIRYDTTPPNVELNVSQLFFDNIPIPLTILFDEPIDNETFSIDDFTITNASLQNLNGSDDTYTVEVIPQVVEGIIEVSIEESMLTDILGYNNTKSNTIEITYDPTPMTVSIDSDNGSSTNQKMNTLNFQFNEVVIDFTKEDFTIVNGTIVSFSGKEDSYELQVQTEINEAWTDIYLPQNKVFNEHGVGNPLVEYFMWVDGSAPTINITSIVTNPTSEAIIPLTIEIDDPVFDFNVDPISCFVFDNICFTEDDIEVSGGTITNFQGSFGLYTMDLLPINKHIEVFIPANVAINATDLSNPASDIFKIEYLNGSIVLDIKEEIIKGIETKYWVDANKNLNIELNDASTSAEIKMVDYSGRVIVHNKIHTQSWQKDLSKIPSGIYLIMIRTKDEFIKSKIYIPNR